MLLDETETRARAMTGNSFGVIQNIKKSTHAEHSRNKIKYKVVDHCEGECVRPKDCSDLSSCRDPRRNFDWTQQ